MLTRRRFCRALVALGLGAAVPALPGEIGRGNRNPRPGSPFAPTLVRNLGMLRPCWHPVSAAGPAAMRVDRMAHEGLALRLQTRPTGLPRAAYAQRLTRELEAIRSVGLAPILLFVTEITGWALARNIPVGCGSGACTGSLVLYALGLTDLDPLVHGLLFERFMRHDGARDICLEVASSGWDLVEAYTVDRARGLGLEVARGQGLFEDVTTVALTSLHTPEDPAVPFWMIELAVGSCAEISLLDRTLRIIEGRAGGCASPSGSPACLDLSRIPLDDGQAYAVLFSDQGPGVCALVGDGRGRVERVVRYQPEAWEGARIAALLRPVGFTDWVVLNRLRLEDFTQRRILPEFLRAKQGARYSWWTIPEVRDVLEDTYGEVLFCEQLLLLAQRVAGMSGEEAHAFRRGLFHGNSDEGALVRQKERFLSGSAVQGVPRRESEELFEYLASRVHCLRGKDRLVGHSLQTYWAGYLKAHYPREFAAALRDLQERERDYLAWPA
jgi:DNA polymerase III alpha subunit